jgi:three-Cys-motif partner protein
MSVVLSRDHGGRPIARDGLIARDNGAWAKDKLAFLDEFVPPALTATSKKLQRYYVDLFAGPGKNIDVDTGDEFDGSALRVLPMRSPRDARVHFTHAKLVNLDSDDHDALRVRVDRLFEAGACPMPRGHVEHLQADANQVIFRILRDIDPEAYALVFADIEKPNQWPWDSVRALRSLGHKSIDLYLLFPLTMGINRLVSWNRASAEVNAPAMTRFYGNEDWRPIVEQRITDAQAADMRRHLLDLYMNQLRGLGWDFVQVARDIKRVGEAGLYKMIYASAHPAGERIATWSAGQADKKNQLGFDF